MAGAAAPGTGDGEVGPAPAVVGATSAAVVEDVGGVVGTPVPSDIVTVNGFGNGTSAGSAAKAAAVAEPAGAVALIGWSRSKAGLPLPPSAPPLPPALRAPTAPVGPVAPVAPVAPVGPVAPVAPVAPVGPVEPVKPVAPVGPVGPDQQLGLLKRW